MLHLVIFMHNEVVLYCIVYIVIEMCYHIMLSLCDQAVHRRLCKCILLPNASDDASGYVQGPGASY